MPSLVTERIESVKVGIISAGAFSIAELVVVVASSLIIPVIISNPLAIIVDWTWSVRLAIGAISGFLFGVTYRYIIRGDRNSHLNDGAVLAFGLVRGLALVEQDFTLSELSSVLFLIISSIVCFAIARLVLDLAIELKLIEPFT